MARSFADRFNQRVVRTMSKLDLVHEANAATVFKEIVFGGPISGAKGQVVADIDGGALRDSWTNVVEGPRQNLISTDSPYAKSNEDGIARPGGGPYIQRAKVGGRHNLALVRAAWPHIVRKNREALANV